MGLQKLRLLTAMLEDQSARHYGFDLMKKTGMLSGTIYPILAKMRNEGLVESEMEEADPKVIGRRPRRYYTITGLGIRTARRELETVRTSLGFAITGGQA